MQTEVKIIIADDQQLFRVGAAQLLRMQEDFRVVAECVHCEQLYRAIDTFGASVVLFAALLELDLDALTDRLESAGSRAIVILENSQAPDFCQASGIFGLAYRNATEAELIHCVRMVAGRKRFLQPWRYAVELQEEGQVGSCLRERLTPGKLKFRADCAGAADTRRLPSASTRQRT